MNNKTQGASAASTSTSYRDDFMELAEIERLDRVAKKGAA